MSESSPLRILLVDDTPEAETYVTRSLGQETPLANVQRVPGGAELSEALQRDRFDVVITEAHVPGIDGLEILRAVKERQPEQPVLMLTSHGDEDLAGSALQAGFDAYVRKAPDQEQRLAAAVNAALETARERAARRRAEEALVEALERERAVVAELRRKNAEKTLILENMLDAVIVTDSEGRYAMVNGAAGRLLGMDPDVERHLRIVVVDDEPALVTMLARLLSSEGHELSMATSGEEALAILAGKPIDVVISDLGMGAGMNGWELAAAVQALPGRPRFILTTGWGAEIDPEDAAARGVPAVVSKPYRPPDLRKILNTI
ncbi:MAG TPA: response regulator [Chloroflexota bacterium]|nr:response regulator [Chloroflexota bacterium]